MSELQNRVSLIKENLQRVSYRNERTIITRVVVVLLLCLGWDVDIPLVVREEYPAIPDQARMAKVPVDATKKKVIKSMRTLMKVKPFQSLNSFFCSYIKTQMNIDIMETVTG